MRRLCRARHGLCLDIVARNTLFNFSLLGHLDIVRYKVGSILSVLMTSSSNWLPNACDTIHLIMLSRVRVACVASDKTRTLKTGICKSRRSIIHLFIVKIKWDIIVTLIEASFGLRGSRKNNFVHGWQRETLDGICIEVEGKLYVTVRERHRGDRIMTKLRTSSARALLRRRFHAVRRFRGSQEDGTSANLRCGPCQDPSVCYANLLALGRRSFHVRFHDGFARKSLAWTRI